MKRYKITLLIMFSVMLNMPITYADEKQGYIVMEDDLNAIKSDFNEASDKVRLVFISGPTCGVCLKAMSDLNEDVLDGNYHKNLRTLIAYVPTLGAKEKDVLPASELITGGNAIHYWEDTGIIGELYQEALGIEDYAWDVWMIYEPGILWDNKLPPKPNFWMHQLRESTPAPKLDSKVFAEKVDKLLQIVSD